MGAAVVTLWAQSPKRIPTSDCSLDVDSTVVIQLPQGSNQQSIELKSDPAQKPTVRTDAENVTGKSMKTTFVSLTQEGTLNGKKLISGLHSNIPTTGLVTNVVHALDEEAKQGKGVMKGGRHHFDMYMQYTLDPGGPGEMKFYNKKPIRVEATIDSTRPSGAVYKSSAGSVPLFDLNSPNRQVATLISMENRLQR